MIPASVPKTLNTQIQEAEARNIHTISEQELVNFEAHIDDLVSELPGDDPRRPRLQDRLHEIERVRPPGPVRAELRHAALVYAAGLRAQRKRGPGYASLGVGKDGREGTLRRNLLYFGERY